MDECLYSGMHICDNNSHAICTNVNTKGSYECVRMDGYKGDGRTILIVNYLVTLSILLYIVMLVTDLAVMKFCTHNNLRQ